MAETGQYEPIHIESHRDFRGHMKQIVTRLNENPEIARLVLVNPIYALQDIGVTLSKDMVQHVHDTFHSPPAKARRMAELEKEILPELEKLPGKPSIPRQPADWAKLVFQTLGVQRLPDDPEDRLEGSRLWAYSHRHPLLPKLMEYERVTRSGLLFHPRATYDAYRRGEKKQHWVNSVRFGPQP